MNFDTICRVCLTEAKDMVDLCTSFNTKNKLTYFDMLKECTKITIIKNDGLPRLICKSCSRKLKKVYSFHKLYEKSHTALTNLILKTEPDKPNLNCKNEDFNLSCTKIKEENVKYLDENIETKNEVSNSNIKFYECGDESTVENKEIDSDCEDSNFESLIEKDDNSTIEINVPVKIEHKTIEFTSQEKNESRENVNLENKNEIDNGLSNNTENIIEEILNHQIEQEKICLERDESNERDRSKNKKIYQCPVCNKVTSSSGNLKSHMISHSTERPFHCTLCSVTYKSYSALYQHKKKHAGLKEFHCEYCSKQFLRKDSLINHIKIHTGEKRYKCTKCPKLFAQQGQMLNHSKRHSKYKPYLCQFCGKEFFSKGDLVVHQRLHSGEKPYKCVLCEKTFATSGNLSIHTRIHKKDVRYRCEVCQKGFVTCSSFNVHMKRHRGQKDHQCECGKLFVTKTALKQHLVVHTGEKKYHCKYCEKRFLQSSHLSRHVKKEHAQLRFEAMKLKSV